MNHVEEEFWSFHEENPQFYHLFDQFTRYAIQRGRKRFGANVIFERIRWETSIEKGEEFKANNNYRAYYARLWMKNNPQYIDFFETRETKAGPVSERLHV